MACMVDIGGGALAGDRATSVIGFESRYRRAVDSASGTPRGQRPGLIPAVRGCLLGCGMTVLSACSASETLVDEHPNVADDSITQLPQLCVFLTHYLLLVV